MTLFLHGAGITLLALGALGLLYFAARFAWAEWRRL